MLSKSVGTVRGLGLEASRHNSVIGHRTSEPVKFRYFCRVPVWAALMGNFNKIEHYYCPTAKVAAKAHCGQTQSQRTSLITERPAEERSRAESRFKRRNHGIARRNDLSKEVKKRCSGGDRDLWITAQSRFLRERISQPLVAPALLAKNR
jgi:hypothetical protein